jgi:hypothetical protein
MFMVPIEDSLERRGIGKRKPTWHNVLAYLVVFISFFLQGVLLYAIFQQTVVSHIAWKDGVLGPGTGECVETNSLCMRNEGKFTCAPPTVQLSGRWDELDVDGDGIWSLEEAQDERESLMCKYGVDPIEVFSVYKKFLLGREKLIYLEPDLREGRFIRQAYFRYAAGDIIMCGYRSSDMCPNLLKRGFFDEPLKEGSVPRIGKTIDSALQYCNRLLEEGGTCERTLPSTYAVWRRSSEDQCGGADFSPMIYRHPSNGDYKSMLEVDYSARQDYHRADNSNLFVIYKSCIIGIYLLAMFVELRDISIIFLWVLKFEAANLNYEPAVKVELNKDGEEEYEITGITTRHRAVMGIFMVLRFGMLIMLTVIGLSFLLKETDYIDLLLNGLGLIFIVEISNLCYVQLLDKNLQDRCERIVPMKIPFVGLTCLRDDAALRDFFWFLGLVILLVLTVVAHYILETAPVADALECTCLSQGKRCAEAHKFDKAFWNEYWMEDIPEILQAIDDLEKTQNGTAAGSAPAPAPVAFGAASVGSVSSMTSSAGKSMMLAHESDQDYEDEVQQSAASWPLVNIFGSFLGSSWGAWGYVVSLVGRPWSDDASIEHAKLRRKPGTVFHHRQRRG